MTSPASWRLVHHASIRSGSEHQRGLADVQAAINGRGAVAGWHAELAELPQVNPSIQTSWTWLFLDTIPRSRLYDLCDSILGQKLSQVEGVGQVGISGGQSRAVRVDLNPNALAHYGSV